MWAINYPGYMGGLAHPPQGQPNNSLLIQCTAQNDLPYSHKIMSKVTSNIFYRNESK